MDGGWWWWWGESTALIRLKPMKMTHYIKHKNFKHLGEFRVQRKRDNAFNAQINMEMNLVGCLFKAGK